MNDKRLLVALTIIQHRNRRLIKKEKRQKLENDQKDERKLFLEALTKACQIEAAGSGDIQFADALVNYTRELRLSKRWTTGVERTRWLIDDLKSSTTSNSWGSAASFVELLSSSADAAGSTDVQRSMSMEFLGSWIPRHLLLSSSSADCPVLVSLLHRVCSSALGGPLFVEQIAVSLLNVFITEQQRRHDDDEQHHPDWRWVERCFPVLQAIQFAVHACRSSERASNSSQPHKDQLHVNWSHIVSLLTTIVNNTFEHASHQALIGIFATDLINLINQFIVAKKYENIGHAS